jgi:hypothetical protein
LRTVVQNTAIDATTIAATIATDAVTVDALVAWLRTVVQNTDVAIATAVDVATVGNAVSPTTAVAVLAISTAVRKRRSVGRVGGHPLVQRSAAITMSVTITAATTVISPSAAVQKGMIIKSVGGHPLVQRSAADGARHKANVDIIIIIIVFIVVIVVVFSNTIVRTRALLSELSLPSPPSSQVYDASRHSKRLFT